VAGVLEAGSETVPPHPFLLMVDILISQYFLDGMSQVPPCHEKDPSRNRQSRRIKSSSNLGR
jgi:hypothetical protein